MRPDMQKVLTERPRTKGRDTYGSLGRSTRAKRIHEDESGHKQGMRRPYMETGDWKEFTDLIGPLYRFLQGSVGRPWRKVHSEICQGLKGRNTQQQHLLDHVERYVESNAILVGKEPRGPDGRRMWKDFYADPRDGILKAHKLKRYRPKKMVEADEIKIDDQVFRRVAGVWYAITMSVAMVTVNGPEGPWMEERREHKRQLGSAELKKRGLANAVVLD